MGIVFGVTGTKGPVYEVLAKTSSYEIRNYNQGFLTAEIPMTSDNEGFSALAKYIGVFGKPENTISQPMAMTHPVIKEENTDTSNEVMKFVLPGEYVHIADAPKPTNAKISIHENPPQYLAVIGFSGWYNPSLGVTYLDKLSSSLKHDGYVNFDTNPKDLSWSVAQYHPPFTIPFLRLNEVWIKLTPEKSKKLKELLDNAKANANK
jgi:hypothetical protein